MSNAMLTIGRIYRNACVGYIVELINNGGFIINDLFESSGYSIKEPKAFLTVYFDNEDGSEISINDKPYIDIEEPDYHWKQDVTSEGKLAIAKKISNHFSCSVDIAITVSYNWDRNEAE